MQDLRAAIVERLGAPPAFPAERFAERGIVICAGGQRYFTCAWILISALRHYHNCTLPIQVWHLGRNEMSEAMRLMLEEEGVEVVNAEIVLSRYPASIRGGWPLKPYAIAHSRFREVLFLDADTVPLTDPTAVFEWELYRRAGIVLWPDIVELRSSNPIWARLGLEPRHCVSVDSGMIAVDKSRNWRLLDLAILFNERWQETYQLLHGDKDTFLLAAILTGVSDPVMPHRPFTVEESDLVQRDVSGDPFVHHRTGSKWKLNGRNQPVVASALAAHSEQALAALRERWTGAIFHAPERSNRARALEAKLLEQARFHYATTIHGARPLVLQRAGVIGEGRSELEQHWAVVERDGQPVLQFFSASRLVVELAWEADGSWRGTSIGERGYDARLVPMDAWRTWPHAEDKRMVRSAGAEIDSLLDPSLFACGFDAEIEVELAAALSLLNRLFDDVSEQLETKLASMPLAPDWRVRLKTLAETLRLGRDTRLDQGLEDFAVPVEINPHHYTRIF
jgi:hypothetical protein